RQEIEADLDQPGAALGRLKDFHLDHFVTGPPDHHAQIICAGRHRETYLKEGATCLAGQLLLTAGNPETSLKRQRRGCVALRWRFRLMCPGCPQRVYSIV